MQYAIVVHIREETDIPFGNSDYLQLRRNLSCSQRGKIIHQICVNLAFGLLSKKHNVTATKVLCYIETKGRIMNDLLRKSGWVCLRILLYDHDNEQKCNYWTIHHVLKHRGVGLQLPGGNMSHVTNTFWLLHPKRIMTQSSKTAEPFWEHDRQYVDNSLSDYIQDYKQIHSTAHYRVIVIDNENATDKRVTKCISLSVTIYSYALR